MYLNQDAGRLIYRREDCAESDVAPGFFLWAFPADENDIPAYMREAGGENMDFGGRFHFYRKSGWVSVSPHGGRCLFARDLPDYPIAKIITGQRADGGAEAWSAELASETCAFPAGEPTARGGIFDIYLDEYRLIYAAKDCAESDTRARFFLSTFPVRADDLSDDSKARGLDHDSLNFDFERHGAVWDGDCAAVVTLPRYEMDAIKTGQFVPGEGELWRAELAGDIRVPDGEPMARGGVFDIYLDEGRLIYFAKDCAESDTRGRFFLSVFPTRAADLSRESQERGFFHNSLNFDFKRRGGVSDGECATVRALPRL